MAMAFTQSMRALAVDRGHWSLASLLVVLGLLGGWAAWFILAHVAMYEVTRTARLEVDQAVHPIATAVAGRVVATHLVVGRDVQAGEILVELDAAAFRLQHDEARQQSTALTAQRQARHQELVAEEAAQQAERQTARTALAEARARQREAEVAWQAATEQTAIFDRLQARGLAPQLDLLRIRAEAASKRAAVDTLRLAVSRLEREQRTRDSDRTARLTQFHRELVRLDGDLRTAEATLARLDYSIEQTRMRAPIAGRLGAVADIQPGAVIRQGDTLGVVVPVGALRVVAHFLPAVALGRVQPGQPARLRLEGFPWAQYGSLAATVSRVANEARDGVIRVELRLEPEVLTTIPLQHGLPGTVEVEVERVSPATLVLRGVGHRLGVSPRGAGTAPRHEGAP